MGDWQDISTAPKDGTTIIGWSEYSQEPCTVRWRNKGWMAVWDGSSVIAAQGDWGTDYEDAGHVTHWMPLPEPPKALPPQDHSP